VRIAGLNYTAGMRNKEFIGEIPVDLDTFSNTSQPDSDAEAKQQLLQILMLIRSGGFAADFFYLGGAIAGSVGVQQEEFLCTNGKTTALYHVSELLLGTDLT